MGRIVALKNGKKAFDRSVDRSVEWHFGFCFQQRCYGGWGLWLRDISRGPWRASAPIAEIAEIAVIAVIGNPRPTGGTRDTENQLRVGRSEPKSKSSIAGGLTALTAIPMMKVWALLAGASLSCVSLFGLHAHSLPRVLFRDQRRYVSRRPAGRRSSA